MTDSVAAIPIPVKAYAIAADEAAFLHNECVADIFDREKPSRARWVTLLALARYYPLAARVHIAQHLGVTLDSCKLGKRVTLVRGAAWWRDADVDHVVSALDRALAGGRRVAAAAPQPYKFHVEREVSTREKIAQQFQPRKVRPARLISVGPRPALDLGDPPPGRREYLAALASPGYSAAREDAVPRVRAKKEVRGAIL